MLFNPAFPSFNPSNAEWNKIREAPLHQLLGKPVAIGDPQSLDAIVGFLDAVSMTEDYVSLQITLSNFATRPDQPRTPRAVLDISIPKDTVTWIGYWPATHA